ncbi:MAG TPA: acetylglutamate kinase [Alphaproteobacteria bacterium]|nr:acetylglutamate kinase [Alphaproteobacteria bacterium]HNS44736.1 acetylglutamate kinase [Alphaproteobacteria bacterium]
MKQFQFSNDVYKKQYHNQIIVVKFGGALAKPESVKKIAEQIGYLQTQVGAKVMVVHGGGGQINDALKAQGIEVKKDPATGLRVTDAQTLDVTDKMLKILNGDIVDIFNQVAGEKWRACGISGYDRGVLEAVPVDGHGNYTGTMTGMKTGLMKEFLERGGVVPVLTSVCFNALAGDGEENRLNVNADEVAVHVAVHMDAARLIVCSDKDGVLNKQGKKISQIFVDQVGGLIKDGTVTDGMIPKLKMLAQAVQEMKGGGGVALVNGFEDKAILKELLNKQGGGTLILER